MNAPKSHQLFFQLITSITLFLCIVIFFLALKLIDTSNNNITDFRFRQASSHAEILANGTVDALLTKDYATVEQWVISAIPNKDDAFALISSPQGKILVHSDLSMVGHNLTARDISAPVSFEIKHHDKSAIEIIHPIFINHTILGYAHVAYYIQQEAGQPINLIRENIYPLILSFFILLIGIFFIVRKITRPIELLQENISNSSIGKYKPIPDEVLRSSEEVSGLAQAFDYMRNSIIKSHNELELKKIQLETTLHSIGDAIITTDETGMIDYMNPNAQRLTGWSEEEAYGKALFDIYPSKTESGESTDKQFRDCLLYGIPINRGENYIFQHRSGKEIAVEQTTAQIKDSENSVLGMIIVTHDVTKEIELKYALEHRATHDDLTGLPNRSEFNRCLDLLIKNSSQQKSEHALLYIDIDQFKIINDTSGHVAGDELLKQVTQLFSSEVRKHDKVFRLGGDEFAIILNDCSLSDAENLAEKIRKITSDYHFGWNKLQHKITISIGLVPIARNNINKRKILSLADAACYTAKNSGRNSVYVLKDDDKQFDSHTGAIDWAPKIANSIKNNLFRLYYQSIHPLKNDGKPTRHIEILLRLSDNSKIVNPGTFLPSAQRYNLMPAIDRWVISNTFSWLSNNLDVLLSLDTIAINLSGDTIIEKDIATYIINELHRYKIPGNKICFEITENVAISNLLSATSLITTLKDEGIKFSLDDFGTGMSSFEYLKSLPVDYLKIDGIFIQDISHDEIDFAMVKSINEIGHIMNIKTIAEFVMDKKILQLLTQIGVDYAQGYYLSTPEPVELFLP